MSSDVMRQSFRTAVTHLCDITRPLNIKQGGRCRYSLSDYARDSISVSDTSTMTVCEEKQLLLPKGHVVVKLDDDSVEGTRKNGLPVSVPLSLEELALYAEDPFWVRMRNVCFVLYWSSLFLLAVIALLLATAAPSVVRCDGEACSVDWWRRDVMYSIYVPSFRDSDGSGVGDLKGIESKLDYLQDIGVGSVWLSPIYKTSMPMVDFGYDVSDYRAVDERFGTLSDFQDLVREIKKRGMRILMDLVLNHTSDEHEWFNKSVHRVEPYSDYYVWVPPKHYDPSGTPLPPNNWLSLFGGSAWEWNEIRGEFYLHQFAKKQPDLNYNNPNVMSEMLDILKFWFDLGVDGFRLDALAFLFEDPQLRDEPYHNNNNTWSPDPLHHYELLRHEHTYNLPQVMDVLQQLRRYVDEYSNNRDGKRKLLMVETYNAIEHIMPYYNGGDFPFNFFLMTDIKRNSTAEDLRNAVEHWLKHLPKGKWPNWVLGNHDNSRVATRIGSDLVDALNTFLLLLPGTAVTYYGEEIGMTDMEVTLEDSWDPKAHAAGPEFYKLYIREPERTPMQWSANKNAGFSEANKTWLAVNPNYKTLNVEAELAEPSSHLNVYKMLAKARKFRAVMDGPLATAVMGDNNVFAFTRAMEGERSFLVVVNWSDEDRYVNVSAAFHGIPRLASIYVRSGHAYDPNKTQVDTHGLHLIRRECLVLTYIPYSEDIITL